MSVLHGEDGLAESQYERRLRGEHRIKVDTWESFQRDGRPRIVARTQTGLISQGIGGGLPRGAVVIYRTEDGHPDPVLARTAAEVSP